MAKFKLKASKKDVETAGEQQEFVQAPPGYYVCAIRSMSVGPNKEGGGERAEIVLRPVFGWKEGETFNLEENYGQVWDYLSLSESSGWKRAQFGKALGLKVKRGEFDEDIEMEEGKPGTVIDKMVLVRFRKDHNLDGEYRPKVAAYLGKDTLDGVDLSTAASNGSDGDSDWEPYSEEELNALSPTDLNAVLAEWDLDSDGYKGPGAKKKAVAAILEAQEAYAAEQGEDASEPEDDDSWASYGEAADEGDDESIAALTEAAEEAGLDPEEYETWVLLAEALDAGAAEGEDSEPEDDFEALGAAADEGDVDAIERLTELAEENGEDPEAYSTWVELAERLAEPF